MSGFGLDLLVALLAVGPVPPAPSWRRIFSGKFALAAAALPVLGLALVWGYC